MKNWQVLPYILTKNKIMKSKEKQNATKESKKLYELKDYNKKEKALFSYMNIKTFNGSKGDFYIQSKGFHSGRPMKTPIPNSFTICTNIPNAYEIMFMLWKSKQLHTILKGSVVPFISIKEYRELINSLKWKQFDIKSLNALQSSEILLTNLKTQIEKLQQLQTLLAKQNFKTLTR